MISVVATGNRMKGAEMPPFMGGSRGASRGSVPAPTTDRTRIPARGGTGHARCVAHQRLTSACRPLSGSPACAVCAACGSATRLPSCTLY